MDQDHTDHDDHRDVPPPPPVFTRREVEHAVASLAGPDRIRLLRSLGYSREQTAAYQARLRETT